MPLSDEHWRFLVEQLLGVQPAQCELLVAQVSARHPAHARAEALTRSFLPRAMIAGAPSGLTAERRKAFVLGLLEQRATSRQRALMLASLGRLDDPRFFERSEWPRYAMDVDGDPRPLSLALRTAGRFALRLATMRTTRGVTRWLGRRASALTGVAVGAAFNALEHTAYADKVLERRARTIAGERVTAQVELVARVVPLPVRRGHPEQKSEGPR